MSTERDIIIERLEQKLAARDKEFEQMQESMRESVITEIEKRFADRIKLRESTLDEIRLKFGEKVNEILEMNKSLRDSIEEQKSGTEGQNVFEDRVSKIERRLVELNSSYDGVMKELLDQKSIIQELVPKKTKKEEQKPAPIIKEDIKQPEKPKPKGEYIIAGNYVPKGKKKEQLLIEAEEKPIEAEEKPLGKVEFNKPMVKRSERVKEGVEIFEAPKKR